MYQQPTDLVRIHQASKITGLSIGHIYRLAQSWYIPVIQKGRNVWFSVSELKQFNEEKKSRKLLLKQKQWQNNNQHIY